MPRFLAPMALCAAFAFQPATAAPPRDFAGAWVIHADWGKKLKYDLLCALTQNGQALAGPCMAAVGIVERGAGALTSRAFDLEYTTTFEGMEAHPVFHGAPRGDGRVGGQVTSGPLIGDFDGAPMAEAPNVWLLDVHLGAGNLDFQLMCVLAASGETLRGPCAPVVGEVLHASGAVAPDAKSVTLAYDTTAEGRPLHVVYAGTVAADGQIKGEASTAYGKGVFTAKRR